MCVISQLTSKGNDLDPIIILPCTLLEDHMDIDFSLTGTGYDQLQSPHGWKLLFSMLVNPKINVTNIDSHYFKLANELMDMKLWQPFINMATLDLEEEQDSLVLSQCIKMLKTLHNKHKASHQGIIQFILSLSKLT
jgi:hypothetical protein